MSTVLEKPIDTQRSEERRPADLDSVFRHVSEGSPNRKVEIIDSRIVVRELSTDDHNDIFYYLIGLLIAVTRERGWKIWPEIYLHLGSQADRYRPDLTVVPARPRMWGKDHVRGDDTLLVVEVVSESSQHDDHVVKPRGCARGKVPLYLVIDTFAGKARLLSHPGDDGYAQQVEVKLGEKLELPDPWNLTLDTGELAG